jgi:acyl-CoA thioester hydrolase
MSDTLALPIDDGHDTTLRVRYSETDAGGLLYHANYVSYFEIARTELFRARGGDYRAMEERGYYFVVVKVECEYKAPARYDDVLTIRARIARLTPAKLEHEYTVTRDGQLIARGRTVLACVDRQGRVQRITRQILHGDAAPA